ncbi:MAG: hypothetical protein DRJ40_03385 [Thermoprotei archaeon]|nr:MAG: hypothetical protein DRJ40_03385 [Thermoprotei archaeon]
MRYLRGNELLSIYITRLRRFYRELLTHYYEVRIYGDGIRCEFCGRHCFVEKGSTGSCGLSYESIAAKKLLMWAVIGLSTHLHSLNTLMRYCGADILPRIKTSSGVYIIESVVGKVPESLGELRDLVYELNEVCNWLVAQLHFGQESSVVELVSLSLFAGLLDLMVCELYELINGVMRKVKGSSPRRELRRVPVARYRVGKPSILVIGHNSPIVAELVDLVKKRGIDVQIYGLCCSAHELSHYVDESGKFFFAGSLAEQVEAVASGIADVVVIDEQCIMPLVLTIADELGIITVLTSPSICSDAPDLTYLGSCSDIVRKVVENKVKRFVVSNVRLAAEVAIELAKYRWLSGGYRDSIGLLARCSDCLQCLKLSTCSTEQPTTCCDCVLCLEACPVDYPISRYLQLRTCSTHEVHYVVSGLDQVPRAEIHDVAPTYVMGFVPGIVAVTGCPEYPHSYSDLSTLVQELMSLGFTVLSAGCTAIVLSYFGAYEHGALGFTRGGLLNFGSCFGNVRIVESVIELVRKWSGLEVRGNYEKIFSEILLRIPIVAALPGLLTEKALALALGFTSFGIPTLVRSTAVTRLLSIVGRECSKYFDRRCRAILTLPTVPPTLFTSVSKRELLTTILLCSMRHCESPYSRRVKYRVLHEQGIDIAKYVRTFYELPDGITVEEVKPGYVPDLELVVSSS